MDGQHRLGAALILDMEYVRSVIVPLPRSGLRFLRPADKRRKLAGEDHVAHRRALLDALTSA